MHKKIVAMGYTSMYNNNTGFALKAKMILSLAFVPLPHIDTYLDALSANIPEELAALLNWFEDNYIGRPKAFTCVAKLPNVLNCFREHDFKMVKCGVATIFLIYFNLNACF